MLLATSFLFPSFYFNFLFLFLFLPFRRKSISHRLIRYFRFQLSFFYFFFFGFFIRLCRRDDIAFYTKLSPFVQVANRYSDFEIFHTEIVFDENFLIFYYVIFAFTQFSFDDDDVWPQEIVYPRFPLCGQLWIWSAVTQQLSLKHKFFR